MAQQTVPLYTVTSGDRLESARTSLAEALGDAKLGEPDDTGTFEVSLDAESPEQARRLVNVALTRAGTGDDFVIRETTDGREVPPDDPRQGGSAEVENPAATTDPGAGSEAAEAAAEAAPTPPSARAARVADAASAVAAAATAARAGDTDAAKEAAYAAADAAKDAASEAADAARAAAPGDAESVWKQFAPIGALLLLLLFVRRRRRR